MLCRSNEVLDRHAIGNQSTGTRANRMAVRSPTMSTPTRTGFVANDLQDGCWHCSYSRFNSLHTQTRKVSPLVHSCVAQ